MLKIKPGQILVVKEIPLYWMYNGRGTKYYFRIGKTITVDHVIENDASCDIFFDSDKVIPKLNPDGLEKMFKSAFPYSKIWRNSVKNSQT